MILSDLRAEIGPRRILDLEQIAHRDIIERSRDLKQAIKTNRLRLVKHSVVKTRKVAKQPVPPTIIEKTVVEKTIEKHKLDEERLRNLIRDTVADEIQKGNREDIGETVRRAVGSGVKDLQDAIRNQLNNIHIVSPGEHQQSDEVNIDPEKLAELQQKSIERISDGIETSGPSKTRKVRITNSNVRDLANEL